jgi:hypothetical protein
MRLSQHISHFETYTDNERLKLKLLDLHYENPSPGLKSETHAKFYSDFIYFLSGKRRISNL